MDATLGHEERRTAFIQGVRDGQMDVWELIRGLTEFPESIPLIAAALGRLGPRAKEALPALRDALVRLEPKPEATPAEWTSVAPRREALANTIHTIAPEQPKPLFTSEDVAASVGLWMGPTERSPDQKRADRILVALQTVIIYQRDHGGPLPPAEMLRALNSLKAVDERAYDAALASIRKIDPHFDAESAK